ncbi:DUF6439 family protein [[Phormidium] sp. ETS-05]|uniref:DUF6439 family protein n=1 Tax=[Phormidium] sp. ETS-05 TaxID=222819 RepID=UPI001E63BAFF|nr:DUF6439 family protein [[Phormidium] sp. ETS-05]
MAEITAKPVKVGTGLPGPNSSQLQEIGTLELARALAERLAIAETDWHRLKSNRKARALEQAAAALVFLLKDSPEEAILRLQQAQSWLDGSISAPPCPTHGHKRDLKVSPEQNP